MTIERRTPMNRGQGFTRKPQPRRARKAINAQSSKREASQARETEIRNAYLRAHPACELTGAPGPCLGAVHVHEPWTRARGGPTDDPRNYASACDFHNTAVSQDVTSMAWAKAAGMLIHAWSGPRWLANGGRMAPGTTKEQAIAEVMSV